ncbi:hypothetical protein G6L33_08710 [Agrobacterium rhizogenes]|nr:hypothetical protein [Rhizobium rhizogenes]
MKVAVKIMRHGVTADSHDLQAFPEVTGSSVEHEWRMEHDPTKNPAGEAGLIVMLRAMQAIKVTHAVEAQVYGFPRKARRSQSTSPIGTLRRQKPARSIFHALRRT